MSRFFFCDDKVLGVYVLIGDHVVDLPSRILEQHIYAFVFWIYTSVITPKRPDLLQIQCYKYRSLAYLNAISHETNTFQGVI